MSTLIKNSKIAQTLLEIKAYAKATLGDYVNQIKITQKNPFEAVNAGELGGNDTILLIGMSSDEVIARGGNLKPVLSDSFVSLILIKRLDCPTEECEEESTLGLYALSELLKNTFDTKAVRSSDVANFTALGVSRTVYLYDEEGIWMGTETTLNTYLINE